MKAINSWIKRNPFLTAVICCILIIPLIGLVSVRTNNFNNPEDFFNRTINEDNLLKAGEDGNYLLKSRNTGTGLEISVAENGAIKLKGTNSNTPNAHDTFDVAKVTLEPGTYTLSSGVKNASKYTCWLEAKYGDTVVCGDFDTDTTTGGTFTLTEATEVTITLCVYPSESWNVTVLPVLVPGAEHGSFYA